MNLAFTREVTPLMYFPLMGKDPDGRPWGFDRYDDIWAGVFAKKILDHLGLAVANGSPFVEHKKASDPVTNLVKEKRGMKVNETLWRIIEDTVLTSKSTTACYRELAEKAGFPAGSYYTKLQSAMRIWGELFD